MTPAFIYLAISFSITCSSAVLGQSASQNINVKNNKECYLKNKNNVESCIVKYLSDVISQAHNGIPELELPNYEPLVLAKMYFNEKAGVVQAEASFKNISIKGFGHATVKSVKMDKKAKTMNLTIAHPYFNVTGKYKFEGTILVMPIHGDGNFWLNLTHTDMHVLVHYTQKGVGIRVTKAHVDFFPKTANLWVDGLLGSDSVAFAINNMINDNALAILMDFKRVVGVELDVVYSTLAKNIFTDLPPEAFIS